VAFFPRDGTDIDALIRKADGAMYRAKEVGSGTFRLYEARMAVASRQTQGLHADLRHALEREQLYVEYQPKVRLSDGRISGVEALLRWRHPTLGEISPATFVPVAEESGLIAPIGEWALREACAQAVAWQKDGLPPLPVAVNVSARQLLTADFEARIIDALQLTGLSPEWLELEITESVIAKDVEQASATICDLRRIGVRFALDDFGTGYSSLGYLKRFQVDRVKIDRCRRHRDRARHRQSCEECRLRDDRGRRRNGGTVSLPCGGGVRRNPGIPVQSPAVSNRRIAEAAWRRGARSGDLPQRRTGTGASKQARMSAPSRTQRCVAKRRSRRALP
jgi:EAL domain-containing protein (putative c-di-GMP-specific phosphodiesterase class I)